MSTLEETHRIAIPQDHPEPMALVMEFYALNGYERREGRDTLEFERGKTGSGWWASTMSELHTLLRCDVQDDLLTLHYCVDIRGQRLNEMERKYWTRESQRLEKILSGKADVIDLRPVEKQRADVMRRRLRANGVTAAIVVFLILSVVMLLAEFF